MRDQNIIKTVALGGGGAAVSNNLGKHSQTACVVRVKDCMGDVLEINK